MAKNIKKESKKSVHESLIGQITLLGADVAVFKDLINDYMKMWDIKEKLIKDINTRGVMFTDKSSVGVEVVKNNPSIKDLVSVNKQMLSLLKELHLDTEKVGALTDDDEL